MNRKDRFGHRTAETTTDAHKAEIQSVFDAGETGPRFCNKHYMAGHVCERRGDHDGEHRTTSLKGNIHGWDS